MANRIGFGQSATLRPAPRAASLYVAPPSVHLGALWLAAAAPFSALLILLGTHLS